MSTKEFYNFSFTLTQNISDIKLPIQLDKKVKKIKIKSVSYTTADNNTSYFMLININNLNSNATFITYNANREAQLKNYTLYIPLQAQQSSQTLYINRFPDWYDCILPDDGIYLPNLKIECLINATYSNLISALNPVYMEVYIES